MPRPQTLGGNIRRERSRARMSNADLAKALGISTSQCSNIQNGYNFPSLPLYIRLCVVFGLKRIPLIPDPYDRIYHKADFKRPD